MSNGQLIIYNCHIHTFTMEHVPREFLPWIVRGPLNSPFGRWTIAGILGAFWPFDDRDLVQRYANFLNVAGLDNQGEVLQKAMGYYPVGTKFVILPMDMAYMSAGLPKANIHNQHDELALLLRAKEFKDVALPFVGIDPRRDDYTGGVRAYLEKRKEQGFQGVKIYPPQGFPPDHDVLMNQVYPACVDLSFPVMTHCSRGGVHSKGMLRHRTIGFTDPDNYRTVLKAHPELRLCLAHFGGSQDWIEYLNGAWALSGDDVKKNWVWKIVNLLRSGEFPNLYTDISYTIFRFQQNIAFLKVLMVDPRIKEKVLFGSDFYMTEAEVFKERQLSLQLRAALGEEDFRLIAQDNPKKYLGM